MTPYIKKCSAHLCAILIGITLLLGNSITTASADDWTALTEKAKGQKVYWNAWGGSETYNSYIAWVGERVQKEYGIELIHVKLADTADAVRRVLAEKTAGRTEDGSIDLIWINGENFRAMREKDLLFGPFADDLPNFALIDVEEKPTTVLDFTLRTQGYESPWGMAKLIFIHDTATVANPPKSVMALKEHALANPGRVTYPGLPDFTGVTLLKQILIELVDDPKRLQKPVGSDYNQVTAPLWKYLEEISPALWRGGEQYPKSGAEMLQLLDDGEIDFTYSFNIGSATNAILEGRLPETARSFVLDGGTIGNTHFVAIPFNSSHKEAAQVVANFIMSPEAQARKQNPEYWGELSVLSMHHLSKEDQSLFENLPQGIATLSNAELGKTLPEPHTSWMVKIEEDWLARFGS